jgi:hypothetical protein
MHAIAEAAARTGIRSGRLGQVNRSPGSQQPVSEACGIAVGYSAGLACALPALYIAAAPWEALRPCHSEESAS